MKLYMRQHVFTIGDRFNVWDEDGHDRWFVEQELLTWGKILRVYDLSGREAASIHQEVLTFRPRFTVTIGGQECAQVVQHFTLFVQEYTVEGPDWHIEGEFLAHEFTAWDGERRARGATATRWTFRSRATSCWRWPWCSPSTAQISAECTASAADCEILRSSTAQGGAVRRLLFPSPLPSVRSGRGSIHSSARRRALPY